MAISSSEFQRQIIISQKTDRICASVLNICSHSFLFCLLISSSLSLMLSCTLSNFHLVRIDNTAPFGRPSAAFEFPQSLFTSSIQDTTPCGVLSSCGCSLSLTLTTSIGIWDGAGATKSSLHSLTLKKFYVAIKTSLSSAKFYIQLIKGTLRDDNQVRIRDAKNKSWWLKGMVWVSVNISSLNLSLTLAFPLFANVDSDRGWFVVQNWRIPPQNGNLLEELSSWTEESFFPCKMTWLALQWWSPAQTLGYFVWWSIHLCLSSTLQDTTPEGVLSSCGCSLTLTHTTSIGIWMVRVPRKEWPVLQLTGVYGMMRVPRNLDFSLSNCPILVEFLRFVINCVWMPAVTFLGKLTQVVVVASWFKIEEFSHKNTISSKNRTQSCSFAVNWPDWAPCSQHLFRLNTGLSVHLCISESLFLGGLGFTGPTLVPMWEKFAC